MTYLCLARKWRPQNFSDLIGQEIIVKTITSALETNRIAHAFLFTGSHGIGKTTAARILAKSLSCEKGISANPCNVCSRCVEIWTGKSIDVIEIDGASNTGVDDIRELRDNVRYLPSNSRFRIFIIDEVHMLSVNAFNALLKILEEPPLHVKFILATTEAYKIPITVLSRCQRYDFKRIQFSIILEYLKFISIKERFEIEKEGLFLIAENANGSIRDALSLLDQVMNFSEEKVTIQNVIDILGIVDHRLLLEIIDLLLKGKMNQVLEILDKSIISGIDCKRLLDGIALNFRHLCFSKIMGSASKISDLSEEQIFKIDQIAKQYNLSELEQFLSILIHSSNYFRSTENPRLVLELAFLKITDSQKRIQMIEIESAITRLESLVKQNSLAKESKIFDETPTMVTFNSNSEKNLENWAKFVQAVKDEMPIIACHLEHARFDPSGIFEFDQKLHFLRLQEALKIESFKSICKRYLNIIPIATLSVSIYSQKEHLEKIKQKEIENKAHSDPTIQKALSIFGGQIRTVSKN